MGKSTVISIGDELLNGRTADTNSHFIINSLVGLGVEVSEVLVLRDNQSVITEKLLEAAKNSDLIVVTGGLGPTSDDITRDAVAQAVGRDLEEDSPTVGKLEEQARRKNRELYDNGRRQALFPEGSKVIDNPIGTANGFVAYFDSGVPVFCLPGVPVEMRTLVESDLRSVVDSRLPASSIPDSAYLSIFGLSESYIGRTISGLGLENVSFAYRPNFPEVTLTISSVQSEELRNAKELAKEALGLSHIFSETKGETLAASVVTALKHNQQTLAVAESCTGGRIADQICDVPGCSDVFLGGVCAYANSIKSDVLGVSEDLLKEKGAVSAEVAKAMAVSVREQSKADWAISTTGIAGPGGGTAEKPVGLIYVGLAGLDIEESFQFNLPYSRLGNRKMAAGLALEKLRRAIIGLSLDWDIR